MTYKDQRVMRTIWMLTKVLKHKREHVNNQKSLSFYHKVYLLLYTLVLRFKVDMHALFCALVPCVHVHARTMLYCE